MAKGFKHGAGGPGGLSLNFQVKAYAAQELLPDMAKENTVAVITETKITSWAFGSAAPEAPEAGAVWVSANSASPVSFNTLKKNAIMVYPGDVFQYENGAWVKKNALFFQNGSWQTVWDGTLFDYGNEYTDYTGGFIKKNNYGSGASLRTEADGSIKLVPPGGESTGGCIYYTANKIDLTNYTTLHFYGLIWNYNADNGCGVGVYSDIGSSSSDCRVSLMSGYRDSKNTEHTLDISALTGSFHIAAWMQGHSNYNAFGMCKLWLT